MLEDDFGLCSSLSDDWKQIWFYFILAQVWLWKMSTVKSEHAYEMLRITMRVLLIMTMTSIPYLLPT